MSTPSPPIQASSQQQQQQQASLMPGESDIANSNYPLTNVPTPHPHDVLCGRGGATNSHIGNSHWRTLVTANKELYVTLPKRQKQLLSKSIVHAVRSQNPPGRFLQKDFSTGLWFDVGDPKAQEKTSQALREGAPQLRDKLKKGETNGNQTTGTQSQAETLKAPPPPQPQHAPPPQAQAAVEEEPGSVAVATPAPSSGPTLYPPVPPAVPAQGPVSNSIYSNNTQHVVHKQQHAPPPPPPPPVAQKSPRSAHFNTEKNQVHADTANREDQDAHVPGPPTMLDPNGEFSFGTISIPDASEVGGLENGFSFGSIMSVVNDASSRAVAPQIIGGPQQHAQNQPQQQYSQPIQPQNQVHSRPPQRDSLADAGGRLMPPTALQPNELSFGSIIMSDAEQARLETNVRQRNSYTSTQSTQRNNPAGNIRFGQQQSDGTSSLAAATTAATAATAPPADDMVNVQPVDGGLEPAGLSAGTMMSIDGTINTNLENAGMSIGSCISAVDGGLEAIGTSFGSMTLGGGGPAKPLPAVAEAPVREAVPTFLQQKRSKGNLLECSDTESEDEEHSAQASAQKSAEWEILKATFEAQMNGGAYTSASVPPALNNTNRIHTAATTKPAATTTTNEPPVLNIPETGFDRDFSQMSAISVGDFNNDDQRHTSQPPPPQNLIPHAAAAAAAGNTNKHNESGSCGEMPPPPPAHGALARSESDDFRVLEATLLNRGNSLAADDFVEDPRQQE